MNNIKIDIESPVKHYDFIDQRGDILATLFFVPTDLDIIERRTEVVNSLNEFFDSIGDVDDMEEAELIKTKNEMNKKLKDNFDYLFGTDTANMFSVAKPLTPMDNGKIWGMVVLEKVTEIIEETTGRSLDAVEKNTRNIDKYTAKYKGGPGKKPGR